MKRASKTAMAKRIYELVSELSAGELLNLQEMRCVRGGDDEAGGGEPIIIIPPKDADV
jgi:hypothetical protein